MNISELSLRRPVLAVVMNLLIVLFGVLGFSYLGVRDYPAIDPPVVSVSTSYSGANADIIESQITEPLEKAVNGIAGVRNITSTSSQGTSRISVEFELGVDMEAAASDVRDKVSQAVRSLPPDLDGQPVVSKSDASSRPIVAMTVGSDIRNQMELTELATNVLVERLETIPGVSGIQIWGERKFAMRLWLDPAKMSAYGITPMDVRNALNKENVELPTGKIAGNATELTIRTFGRLATEEDFKDLIIKSEGGSNIRFKDIGSVVLGPENEETVLKESLVPMIALAVIPQPGANYVEIYDEFMRRMDQFKNEMPPDITMNVGYDNVKFIKKSILEVEETLLIAFVLVVLVIYLFFRDWIIAFRPLIDIPVSLTGAFFIMYLFGFTINILTLLAIVLATGLVVDDGCDREHLQKDRKRDEQVAGCIGRVERDLLCGYCNVHCHCCDLFTHYFPGRICWKTFQRVRHRVGRGCTHFLVCIPDPNASADSKIEPFATQARLVLSGDRTIL